MAECLNCGSENPEGTAFCMECGHPLDQPSKEESDNGQENSEGESTAEPQAISLDDKEKEPSTDAENIDGDTPKAEQVQDPSDLEDGDEALEHQGATTVAHETGREGEPSESADAVIENEDNSDGEDEDGKDGDPDAALIEDGSNPDNETAEERDADGGDVDQVGKDAKSENEPAALNETTNEDEAQKKESDVTLDGPDSPEDLDGVIEPEGCAETNGEAANVEDAEGLSGDFADTADHPDPGTSPTGADDSDQTDDEEPDPEKHAAVDDPHDEGIVDVETDGAPSEELTSGPGDEATNEAEHQAAQGTIGHGEHSGSGAIDGPVDAGPLAGLPEPPEGPPSPLTSEDGGQEEHGIRWWLAPEPEEAPTNASSATQELQEVTSDGVKAAIPRPVVEVDHRIGHDEPIEPSTGSSSLPLIAAAVVIAAVIGYLVL